jgi:DNA-binding LacI/PurR family transcriptional regulator
MAVTMKDVAERAGVSLPTVSRVINDTSYVNTETRLRVLAAIEELHYSPNQMAASLRSNNTKTLALLVPDIASSFWTTVLRGVEDEAMARGYHLFLGNTDDDPAKEARYIEGLMRQRIEGLLIAPTPKSAPLLRRLAEQGMHCVVVHRPITGIEIDTVRSDAYASAVILTQHLLAAGCRRIAFIGGEIEQGRLRAYRDTLTAAGHPLDPSLVRIGPLSEQVGEQLVNTLLEHDPAPDAMFIGNNRLATGALHALGKANARRTEQIAIAAFYDSAALSAYAPPMIAAIQPAYEIGRHGARRLFDRLADKPVAGRDIVLSNQIMVVGEGQARNQASAPG